MITIIDDYFSKGCGRCDRFDTPDCSTKRWSEGLAELRNLCLQSGLLEAVKWGHPCYMHRDRNIAIIGALREDFRLSFFDAALMKDPERILQLQGPNTPYPDMIRFTSDSQVLAMRSTILDYLKEAMGYAEAGIKPPKENREIELPIELVEALERDSELSIAFHALTPGRQRSYVIALSSARKPETRIARIAKFREKILAGKGAMER
ncbi:MAG: YdeI/OmpD-associated family protein [Pirellula sp.]|jgi:uncharacterized protein YdeI (YjbR/CyaY-like superfamily)|nr:YdeI/OmpD-associated family protein [Pirellula sp.]